MQEGKRKREKVRKRRAGWGSGERGGQKERDRFNTQFIETVFKTSQRGRERTEEGSRGRRKEKKGLGGKTEEALRRWERRGRVE